MAWTNQANSKENHWIKAARVALDSSESEWDGASDDSANLSDYATLCLEAYAAAGVDERDVAVGGDAEMNKHQMYETPPENWALVIELHHMVANVFINVQNKANPKLFMDNPTPIHPQLRAMEGPTPPRQVTMLNNQNLCEWEKYGLTLSEVVNKYSDIQYSVMDMQDLLDGEGAGTYDIVRVGPRTLHAINNRVVDAVLGLVTVGGMLIMTETSCWQSTYNLGVAHKHRYVTFNRHIAAQANFNVYHIPMEQGVIVAHRMS